MLIEFTINSVPVAEPRKRTRVISDGNGQVRGVQHYTSAKHPVSQWRYDLRHKAVEVMEKLGYAPLAGIPLVLEVRFYLPRPKWADETRGRGKNKRPKWGVGPLLCWKKPDLDNLLKSTKDSLNGVCYHDDSQIVGYGRKTRKYYHEAGGYSRCEISIWTVSPFGDDLSDLEPEADLGVRVL